MLNSCEVINSHYILRNLRRAIPLIILLLFLGSCFSGNTETTSDSPKNDEPHERSSSDESSDFQQSTETISTMQESTQSSATTADDSQDSLNSSDSGELGIDQLVLWDIVMEFDFSNRSVILPEHPHFGVLSRFEELNPVEQQLYKSMSELNFWLNQDFEALEVDELESSTILGGRVVTVASLGSDRFDAGVRLSTSERDFYADVIVYYNSEILKILSIRLTEADLVS